MSTWVEFGVVVEMTGAVGGNFPDLPVAGPPPRDIETAVPGLRRCRVCHKAFALQAFLSGDGRCILKRCATCRAQRRAR